MADVEGRSATTGAPETEALGAALAARLRPGDVVLVEGELGVGKTTMIRGACRALGVRERVSSPTFTIGRRYEGVPTVSHLDLYRLSSLAGEDPALLEDYLTPEAISFVEWPGAGEEEIVASTLAAGGRVLRVELRHAGADRREVEVGWRR